MKQITRKLIVLLTAVFCLFNTALRAQCGIPPVATAGSVSCNGGTASVTINLNLMGGPYKVTPYIDYQFPTMQNPWDFAYNIPGPTYTMNLAAGAYTIYIVDLSFGCYDSVLFTITEPQILNFAPGTAGPSDCSGTPLMGFTMAGGTAPYTISYTQDSVNWYNLTTTFNTTYSSTSLPIGSYAFKLTDANGCVQPPYVVFGSAPGDQSHWYVGMCGVIDSAVSYLTNGNQVITRSIMLHMLGIGNFSDTLSLMVDYGDGSPIQSFSTEVRNAYMPIPLAHTYAVNGVYKVTYTAINVSNPDTVTVVEFINNNSDVWPGDADGNGVADNMDLLNIGLGFSSTGAVRPGANISWTGQACNDWSQSFNTGLNYKHADCDGNGVIGYPDTIAIVQNYGQSHVLRVMGPQAQGGPTDPTLAVEFPSGNYPNGTHVTVPVTLGSTTLPASNVYGIAFTVNYPANAIDANSVGVSFGNSWLGTVGTDAVAIRKNFASAASIDVAVSRNNQLNISGFGTVCELNVITIDNVSGKLSQLIDYFTLSNVRLIDNNGNEIPVNLQNDSISYSGTSGIEAYTQSSFSIYPNPAKDAVNISSGDNIEEITITNMLGQSVMSMQTAAKDVRIETNNMKSGLYLVKIRSGNKIETRRIEISK